MKNFMEKHVEGTFMKKGIHVSGTKDKLCVLVKAVFLLGFQSGIADYDSVTKRNSKSIAEEIAGRYTEEEKRKLWDVLEYLGDAGFRSHAFLTEENTPFVIACARKAMVLDRTPKSFHQLVDCWKKDKKAFRGITNSREKMRQFENSMRQFYGGR